MTTTVGILIDDHDVADALWHQTDGLQGRHGDIQLLGSDPRADQVLVLTSPARPHGLRPPLSLRIVPGRRGTELRRRWRLDEAYRRARLEKERTTVLFYEPPTFISDLHYETAHVAARAVFGPDPRAGHACVLPTTWKIELGVADLRALEPKEPIVPLVCVTSGKAFLPGHTERLEFLARLRRAGVPFDLYGQGVDPALGTRGSVTRKAAALQGARFTLAIENYAEGEQYVTEKLWDPLLVWSLPIYWGSRAADGVVPSESFIRLPDLGDAGVETVKAALADPGLWNERLAAIAEARQSILGELRLVEWIRRHVVGRNG